MSRWEYALLSADWMYDSQAEKRYWNIRIDVHGAGSITKEVEVQDFRDYRWLLDEANALGADGWEMVDRNATGAGSDGTWVSHWVIVFKRTSD